MGWWTGLICSKETGPFEEGLTVLPPTGIPTLPQLWRLSQVGLDWPVCKVATVPGCNLMKSLYGIPRYCECQAIGTALDSPEVYHDETTQEKGAPCDFPSGL